MTDRTLAHPLQWPHEVPRTPSHRREQARFGRRQGYSSTRLTLAEARTRAEAELYRMGARGVVFSSDLALRNDGLPRSGQAKPRDPGIVAYCELRGERLAFPCDRYDRIEDNLAAIAKHLEALRGIDRWGVGKANAIFEGFKSLPAKGGTGQGVAHWSDMLEVEPTASEQDIRRAYRDLARIHHPDRGGDAEKMAQITVARDVALREIGAAK